MIVTHSVIVLDPTADLQAAIDAAPDYATIKLPPGIFTAPDAGGFVIDHPITLEGAGNQYIYDGLGAGGKTLGTILRPYNAGVTADGAKDSTVITLTVTGTRLSNVVLKDFAIENPYGQPAPGTGDGIRLDGSGYCTFCRFENVSVYFMGRDGLHMEGVSLGDSFDQSTLSRVQVAGCARHGAYFEFCTDVTLDNCLFVGNLQCGVYELACSDFHLDHCLFNNNGASFVNDGSNDWLGSPSAWPYYHQAQVYLQGCFRSTINRCDFEVWNGEPVPHAIGVEGLQGGCITNCATYNAAYALGAQDKNFIIFTNDVQGVVVSGNQVSECDNYIYVVENAGSRGNVILPAAVTVADGAPCATVLFNDLDSEGTPSGGSLALIPLATGATGLTQAQFAAGLQLPVISATSAFTHLKNDGTLSVAADAKALKLYQDGAWQTVAAGVVSYEGDVVTYDDDVVSY